MAVSIPSSLSFELISKLPSESFVIESRTWLPDVAKPEWDLVNADKQAPVDFHLRLATNEFLLNTECFVAGHIKGAVNNIAIYLNQATPRIAGQLESFQGLAQGPSIFQSARESFNAGALPLFDNQDSSTHQPVNAIRTLASQRVRHNHKPSFLGGMSGIADDVANLTIEQLEGAGYASLADRGTGIAVYGTNEGNRRSYAKAQPFSYPLGYYSSLINSHSVLPLGLMSSYSINGYGIRLRFQDPNQIVCRYNNVEGAAAGMALTHLKVSGLAIRGKIIKVLDPSVMSAVLGLFEKSQQISVGGVQFPLSLRLNTLNYRHYTYPVNQGLNHWRLPSTDKSVRGVAWLVHYPLSDVSVSGSGFIASGNENSDKHRQSCMWPLAQREAALTRLFVKAGSMKIMDGPVEDNVPSSTNVVSFVRNELKKVGASFSPFPYYQENSEHSSDLADWISMCQRPVLDVNQPSTNAFGGVPEAVQCGYVSFQNMDYRESDQSTNFQASGIDLTNVGSVEMEMRYQRLPLQADYGIVTAAGPGGNVYTETDRWNATALGAGDLQITFVLCHDTVIETSPSGVADITNAVL
jgi:hypothetical protein